MINQFLVTRTNDRNDAWGGSFANRMRLPVEIARAVEEAGATIMNTGIGWHEARVPTIATSVPRGGFAWVTQKLKGQGLSLPLVATNRINTPEVAEAVLAS